MLDFVFILYLQDLLFFLDVVVSGALGHRSALGPFSSVCFSVVGGPCKVARFTFGLSLRPFLSLLLLSLSGLYVGLSPFPFWELPLKVLLDRLNLC